MLTCTFPASPIRCASSGARGIVRGAIRRLAGSPGSQPRRAGASAELGRARAQACSLARDRREVGEHAQRSDDLVGQPVDLLAPGDGEQPFRRAARCGASGSPSASSRLCGTRAPAGASADPRAAGQSRADARAARRPDIRSTARSAPATASADRQMTSRGSSPPGAARERAGGLGDRGEGGIRGRRGRIIQGTHPATYRRVVPRAIGASRRRVACDGRIRVYRAWVAARTPEGRDILATSERTHARETAGRGVPALR